MRCVVQTSTGEKIPFNFNRQDSVSKIKGLISKELEKPKAALRLIYLGKQLEDDFTLYDYSVRDNATILVSIKVLNEEIKTEKVVDEKIEENKEVEAIEETKVEKAVLELPNDNKNTNGDTVPEKKPTLYQAGNPIFVDDAGNIVTVDKDGNKTVIPQEDEDCKKCNNTLEADCKECGCNMCGKKSSEELILICDECQYYFHTFCLPEPLEKIPEGDWYCFGCYNDPDAVVNAGQKSKIQVKKQAPRQWDNGMACASVTKKCTIVKSDHIGSIPGVPVGSSFRYRVHLSESGVHRPPVAGIHGSGKGYACSIVLAGGYEDDKDFGEYFYYTGSGGRDLSGNKRTAVQSSDQELTRTNLSLANTMKRPINTKDGDVSPDWKKSSPVRVSRSYKLNKDFTEFAPVEGVRYDGLYKLVRYWPEKGQQGFIVWRYEFRRDDPEPAPWTLEGKKRIEELGLVMYNPDGDVTKDGKAAAKKSNGKKGKKKGGGKGKREEESDEEKPVPKKQKSDIKPKTALYKPDQQTLDLIEKDFLNFRTWKKILEKEYSTMTEFLDTVMGVEFICPICQDTVHEPISTRCGHNVCQSCLKNSLLHYGNLCPLCRGALYPELEGLGKSETEKEIKALSRQLTINNLLVNVLKHLVPSYTSGN